MKITLSLFIAALLASSTLAIKGDDDIERRKLNETELIEQSKSCSSHLWTGKDACIASPNCCFFEEYVPLYDEHQPRCIGVDVYIKYYVGGYGKNIEKPYLNKIGVGRFHTRVRESSFCEIVDYDPHFQKIRKCQCLAKHKVYGNSFVLSLLIVWGLVFSIFVFNQ